MILVVGATGQLGSLVVRRLRGDGRPVRAMVREPASAEDLAATGAELVTADLRRSETLDAALTGVEAVIATANVVAPTHPGDTSAALDSGYEELVSRSVHHGVRRFVVASIQGTPLDDVVPVARTKRRLERLLEDSGLSYVSLRLPALTEVWLAAVGSALPLRGEQRFNLERPYAFLRVYRRLTGRTVDRHGVMLVPGPPSGRNAFISVHDAARLMTAAIDSDLSGCVDVSGPEILSWNDVADAFREVLGRPVRVIGTPAAVFAVAQRLLAPFAPSVSDIMGLQRLAAAAGEPATDTHEVTDRLGVTGLRTLRQVLQEKAGLPTAAPSAARAG